MNKNKRTITPQTGNARMIAVFLRGSKMFFFIGMISAAVTALADMVIPQIIRITVDNILPGAEPEPGSAAKILTDAGNTVVVIEHNLDVIKCSDHIIDLGPEGGDGGGTVICTGTPREVSKVPGSFTGQYLKRYFPE